MKSIIVRVSHRASLWLNYKEVGLETPKLTEPNPTTNALKKQEPYTMVFIPTVRKTLSFRSQDVSV
ncbi:hypothetical protein HpBhutan199_00670 [Helicobacter pylori]